MSPSFTNTTELSPRQALSYTTLFCCDRHPGSGFQIRRYFSGRLLYQDPQTLDIFYGGADEPDRQKIVQPPKAKRKRTPKSRPIPDRDELAAQLLVWRLNASTTDPLAAVRPISFIIDDKGILALAKLHPNDINDRRKIVTTLNETVEWDEEWSQKILNVIQKYDTNLSAKRKAIVVQTKERAKWNREQENKRMFDEESKKTEERIREQMLLRLGIAGPSREVLQPVVPIHNVAQCCTPQPPRKKKKT